MISGFGITNGSNAGENGTGTIRRSDTNYRGVKIIKSFLRNSGGNLSRDTKGAWSKINDRSA